MAEDGGDTWWQVEGFFRDGWIVGVRIFVHEDGKSLTFLPMS